MGAFIRFFDGKVVKWFIIGTYAYFCLIILIEVIRRYGFGASSPWGEMTARYAFVYLTYVAAAEAKALGEMRTAQLQVQSMNEREAIKAQLHMIDSRIKAEKNDIARGELLLQKEALVHKMLMDQPDIGIDPEGKKMSEVLMNDEYGSVQGAEG